MIKVLVMIKRCVKSRNVSRIHYSTEIFMMRTRVSLRCARKDLKNFTVRDARLHFLNPIESHDSCEICHRIKFLQVLKVQRVRSDAFNRDWKRLSVRFVFDYAARLLSSPPGSIQRWSIAAWVVNWFHKSEDARTVLPTTGLVSRFNGISKFKGYPLARYSFPRECQPYLRQTSE